MADEKPNEGASTFAPSATAMLGEMVWLYSMSELHRKWPMCAIHQWLMPAIMHKQFKLYHRGRKPVGLVTWAWMSKEVEDAYVRNVRSLHPKDWNSGDRGWILDYVAPFGDALRIGEDLKSTVFADNMGRYLRVKKGSDTMRISYLHGTKRLKDAADHSQNPTVQLNEGRVLQ
ncbi:toxin-activating lysine-acyltransferase [Roseicyclus amphidinii]|uniref:toxin-activating lysine-acyltransferase n=1 Tax=Roseicyclus amphidinii TaxID=3034232 RepID=UPI0024E14965|nr:toxin-activating lysine-acyltransferase [Roseicyclus sp. Amp-Y-6]